MLTAPRNSIHRSQRLNYLTNPDSAYDWSTRTGFRGSKSYFSVDSPKQSDESDLSFLPPFELPAIFGSIVISFSIHVTPETTQYSLE